MADLTVSRKIAILAYLDRGASALGEMATHFHTTPARMRRELSELFVMEIPNAGYFESPVDIAIPDDDDGEVRLIANDTRTSPSLSLAEVLTLMAVLDDHLGVVDASTRAHLLRLRQRVVQASAQAGYGAALWPAPSVNAREITDCLTAAMRQRRLIELTYLKAGADLHLFDDVVTVAPVSLTTGARPRLIAAKDGQLRTYRLDRIVSCSALSETFTQRLDANIRAQFANNDGFSGEHVTICCTPAARWVVETLPVDSFVERDGNYEITLTARSLAWLRTLLIRMGRSVIRVEPEHIAREIAAQAKQYLEEA
ncbi:WYL domain-containing protein [Trueperella pyogenes]|uniref:helix-turn-helix transcriptional regulator n=1 Tax=Trueperella pyogenes TaxID=1661 RepID=UPI00345C96A9